MIEKIKHLKLSQKIYYGYNTIIILMVISSIFSMIGLGVSGGKFISYVQGPLRASLAIKECRTSINKAESSLVEMVLKGNTDTYGDYRSAIEESLNKIETELEIIKNSGIVSDELYKRFEDSLLGWGNIGSQAVNELKAGNMDTVIQLIFNESVPILDEVEQIADEIDVVTAAAQKASIARTMFATIAGIALSLVFIVTTVIVSKKVGRRVIENLMMPIHEIKDAAKELSIGNLHSNIEFQSEDELGDLAQSLRESIQVLSAYVDDIARVMKGFSEGDFTIQDGNAEWKGDFVGILDSFIQFEKSMSETVKKIQCTANEVDKGAQQIAASSMDLAEGATEQAGVTAELSTAVDNVSQRISQNAGSAKEISENVNDMIVEIQGSNRKMQEMMDSMHEINSSTGMIRKIIETIEDIATQTNLLSLNASIEAARAGEEGKGFAIVAEQVSVLAAQSANAVQESSALIKSSVAAVEKGMVIANETEKLLEKIVADSVMAAEAVNNIAVAMEEQAVSIEEINKGIQQINEVVQNNSATSQECAAASTEMSGQANSLKNSIRRFTVA